MMDWEFIKKQLYVYLIVAGAVMLGKVYLMSYISRYVPGFLAEYLAIFGIIVASTIIFRKIFSLGW